MSTGAKFGPRPAPPESKLGTAFSTNRQRHLRTAASHSLATTTGGSTARSRSRPASVVMRRASCTVQPKRIAVATNAAPGPRTTLQGLTARSSRPRADVANRSSARRGIHCSQMACDHSPMGPACAAKAGSAFPASSAMTSAKSKDWPQAPVEGAAAAAAALRWRKSIDGDTPMIAWPYVMAAMPPVRSNRAVDTPAARRRRKRGNRCRNARSRPRMTCAFLRAPAPSPQPSDLTWRT